jgi:outer membrane protein OmpA-like peptidoglycan-associated protein
MRSVRLHKLGLLLALLIACAAPSTRAQAPASAPARDDIVNALSKFDTGPDLDIPALKQKISDRSKQRGKNEPEPSKRPPIVPELRELPTFNVAIHFDVDTPIILPDSYETVGRIADAMVSAPMLPYTFLIVGHTDSTGRREANVLLSQRRADAIRDVLANTFKISTKRLQSLGLGEEQFIDSAHPTSPVNLQIQIVTVGKVPETNPAAQPAAAVSAKKSAKKKK